MNRPLYNDMRIVGNNSFQQVISINLIADVLSVCFFFYFQFLQSSVWFISLSWQPLIIFCYIGLPVKWTELHLKFLSYEYNAHFSIFNFSSFQRMMLRISLFLLLFSNWSVHLWGIWYFSSTLPNMILL